MLQRSSLWAAAVLVAFVAAAPAARAQMTELRSASAAGAGPLATGDSLGYEVSLSVKWRIDETYDPLYLASRLALDVIQDGRSAGEPLLLAGRLAVRQAKYAGPSGQWYVEPASSLFRPRLEALRARVSGAVTAARYADRVSQAEEALGLAAIVMSGRPFVARVSPKGEVAIEPVSVDRLVPDLDPAAETLLRAYLAQAVRFLLPSIKAEDRDDLATSSRARTLPEVRCDGVLMSVRGTSVAARHGGKAMVARADATTVGADDGLFTLPALLGARYDAKSAQPAGLLDLAVPPASRRTEARGDVVLAERYGFAVRRVLEVGEDLTGRTSQNGSAHVRTHLRWQASLREAHVRGTPGASVEP